MLPGSVFSVTMRIRPDPDPQHWIQEYAHRYVQGIPISYFFYGIFLVLVGYTPVAGW